jgi:hypothetical protein
MGFDQWNQRFVARLSPHQAGWVVIGLLVGPAITLAALMFYSYGWQGFKVYSAVMLALVLVFWPWLWSKRSTREP